MNKKSLIIAIYSNKLMGKPFKTVCSELSHKFNTSEKLIKKYLYELQQDGRIMISDGIINSKNYVQKQKDNQMFETNDFQNLVLGVIEKDNKGCYYFKPSATTLPEIPLIATEEVKNSVGKRCCCDIQKRNNLLNADVKQIFGEIDDPISENIAIAYKYGFQKHFSQDVLDEVAVIPQEVLKTDLLDRTDMRDMFFMTWDPATCKDKDDAIYAEKTETGYRVYVAIADVSHYVLKGSELDKEAFRRSTSCYLGSGVYPMLPPELSNGICSLNEGVDRLALVSTIDINSKGKIVDYKFEKAVINVKQAFSYEDAEKVYLSQKGFDKKYAQAKPYTDMLYEVTDVLERRLKNRGSLDFLNFEPEFKFNAQKNVVEEIENTGTERSHKVVEEFMILANEATAKYFKENEIDGIYRVHGTPDKSKLKTTNDLLKKYHFMQDLTTDNKSYQKLLGDIKNSPAKEYLNSLVMQTMNKAKYSAENIGHFGLASTGYTHFTSPIRRYSDTIAHRIISEHLEYGKTTESKQHLSSMAEHLNEQEIKATKAEQESDKFLCCLWAEKHIDEVINGYIVTVAPAQIVVRHKGVTMQIPSHLLKNGLNANYVLSNDLQTLKDKNSGQSYSVGDYIDFKIEQVDKSNYTIFGTTDFELKNEKSKQHQTDLESENLLLK